MKCCIICKDLKPLLEYYKHPAMADGHLNKCKACTKKGSKSRYFSKSEDREWLSLERARCREKQRRYRMTNVDRTSQATKKKWAMANSFKIKSERIAQKAVKNGTLKKPNKCSRCPSETDDLEMHHEDYSKPLDVEWLCTICHGETRWKAGLVDRRVTPCRTGH